MARFSYITTTQRMANIKQSIMFGTQLSMANHVVVLISYLLKPFISIDSGLISTCPLGDIYSHSIIASKSRGIIRLIQSSRSHTPQDVCLPAFILSAAFPNTWSSSEASRASWLLSVCNSCTNRMASAKRLSSSSPSPVALMLWLLLTEPYTPTVSRI